MNTSNLLWRSLLLSLLSITLTACDDDDDDDFIPDTTPNAFTFQDVEAAELNSLVTSETITVSGINWGTAISVQNGEYSVDGGAFTSTAGTIENGDRVAVRHRTSTSPNTDTQTRLSIGNVNATFTSTTEPADTTPDAFQLSAKNNVALDVLVESNSITINGVNVATPISVSGGEYSIDGGAFTSANGTVNSGQTVVVRHQTPDLNDTVTETTLVVGGVSDTFTSTTLQYDGQLALIASGADLVLLGVDSEGNMTERSRASLVEQLVDYNTNHVIFSITKHPTMEVVYVTSFNECGAGPLVTDGCWGNGRVDRFSYDSNTVTYDGLAFLAQTPLRLSTPAFDADTSVVTTMLRNQGSDEIEISSVTATYLTAGSTLATTCDNVTLAAGEQCQIQVTAGPGVDAEASLAITTPDMAYDGAIEYTGDGYHVTGIDADSDVDGLPDCANSSGSSFYQNGACALTAMAFTPDGTRAYINEDDYDYALVMAVDASGKMTFLSEGAGVDLQGIAVNSSNTAMYNGSNAYSITDDVVDESTFGIGGNATEVVSTTGGDLLVTTIDNTSLEIFELSTDPLAPIQVASATPTTGRARFQDFSDDLSLFVTIDFENITAFSFDGSSTLAEIASLSFDLDEDFADCLTCDYRAYTRAVQVSGDGSLAIGSVFVNAYDEVTLEDAPYLGAAVSFSIDVANATITEVARLPLTGMARSILFVETP